MITAFDASNVILHIILISVFIGIFFFTYGSYIERKVIEQQISLLVSDLFTSGKILYPEITGFFKKVLDINKNINKNKNNNTSEEDKKVIENNNKVLKKAFTVISVGIIIGLFLIIIISKKLNREGLTEKAFWIKLLKYNVVALIFIGMTEFIFATFFVKNYMSIDINRLKKSLIDTIISNV